MTFSLGLLKRKMQRVKNKNVTVVLLMGQGAQKRISAALKAGKKERKKKTAVATEKCNVHTVTIIKIKRKDTHTRTHTQQNSMFVIRTHTN